MDDLRSLAETAAFFGVSQPTVKRWIDAGCPVAEKGSNGIAYQMDLAAVAGWRRDQDVQAEADAQARAERDAQLRLELLGPHALTVDPDAPALSPRQRADALQAEVSRTRLGAMRRELVPAEPMALALSEVLALLKQRLRQLPDALAPELGLSESQSARMLDLVDDALNDTADAIEALLTDDPASPP